MREILFKITKDKEHIKPRTRQWAGMQYEDNATEVKFDLSELSLERALYRIDFNSAGAGYQPSENLIVEGNTIRRAIPSYVTQYGGEVQVTAVITIFDENGEATGTCLSYPVLIYFTDVEKDAEGSKNAEKNISESEASALDAAERAEKAAQYASESEEAAEEAKEKTEMARRALEEGSEFVFSGGDAFRESEIDLVVDGELSEFSNNPISNKAVTKHLNKQKQDIDKLLDSINTLNQETLENKESIDTLKLDYIVEQGTSGIWTYRKWASGLAECWGTLETTKIINTPYGNIFRDSTDSDIYAEYPFIFAEIPNCVYSGESFNALWYGAYSSGTTSRTPKIYVYRATALDEAATILIRFTVKGRWK